MSAAVIVGAGRADPLETLFDSDVQEKLVGTHPSYCLLPLRCGQSLLQRCSDRRAKNTVGTG
jgi:hypothetical protein